MDVVVNMVVVILLLLLLMLLECIVRRRGGRWLAKRGKLIWILWKRMGGDRCDSCCSC